MNVRSALGLCLLAAAVLAHPKALEGYLILDGHIDRPGRVYAVQAALAAAGLVLTFASRRQPASRAPRSPSAKWLAAIAVGVSSLAGVTGVELALRMRPELALDGAELEEWRWRQRQGVTPPSYAFDSFDRELGWVPSPNFTGDGVRTNSQGIRANSEYAPRAAPGVRRIELLGDSFTWGERTWHGPIANEETFAALLEQRLDSVESVNLGVHGWGTDQQLLYLRRLGLSLHPDLVVVDFFELDYERNGSAFFAYAKPRFVLENGALRLVDSPVPTREELLARPFDLPTPLCLALWRKASNAVLNKTKLRPYERRDSWRVTEAIFAAMKRESEAAGARLLLVDIPAAVSERPSATEAATARWAERTNTEYLSLRAAFAELPESQWDGLYDGHFSAAGHRAAADALAEFIRRRGLLER
jgi:hypothetical protein